MKWFARTNVNQLSVKPPTLRHPDPDKPVGRFQFEAGLPMGLLVEPTTGHRRIRGPQAAI